MWHDVDTFAFGTGSVSAKHNQKPTMRLIRFSNSFVAFMNVMSVVSIVAITYYPTYVLTMAGAIYANRRGSIPAAPEGPRIHGFPIMADSRSGLRQCLRDFRYGISHFVPQMSLPESIRCKPLLSALSGSFTRTEDAAG